MRRTYVIVQKRGCVPDRKLPMNDTRDALCVFLRELVLHHAADTGIIVLHVSPDLPPEVQCGREWLSMFDRRWAKSHRDKLFTKSTDRLNG